MSTVVVHFLMDGSNCWNKHCKKYHLTARNMDKAKFTDVFAKFRHWFLHFRFTTSHFVSSFIFNFSQTYLYQHQAFYFYLKMNNNVLRLTSRLQNTKTTIQN
jgi:hypothetical protein